MRRASVVQALDDLGTTRLTLLPNRMCAEAELRSDLQSKCETLVGEMRNHLSRVGVSLHIPDCCPATSVRSRGYPPLTRPWTRCRLGGSRDARCTSPTEGYLGVGGLRALRGYAIMQRTLGLGPQNRGLGLHERLILAAGAREIELTAQEPVLPGQARACGTATGSGRWPPHS